MYVTSTTQEEDGFCNPLHVRRRTEAAGNIRRRLSEPCDPFLSLIMMYWMNDETSLGWTRYTPRNLSIFCLLCYC
ncbi:hypothetical protein Hanom_Chr17g01542271 [Helianthus anomalus]